MEYEAFKMINFWTVERESNTTNDSKMMLTHERKLQIRGETDRETSKLRPGFFVNAVYIHYGD